MKEEINMTKDRINVRMKTLKSSKTTSRNRHDYRKYTDKEYSKYSHIDTSRIKDNIYSMTEKEEKQLLKGFTEAHEKLYKNTFGRLPQKEKVTSNYHSNSCRRPLTIWGSYRQ